MSKENEKRTNALKWFLDFPQKVRSAMLSSYPGEDSTDKIVRIHQKEKNKKKK